MRGRRKKETITMPREPARRIDAGGRDGPDMQKG